MIRKNTRFRLYVLALTLSFSIASIFLLHRQRLIFERRLADVLATFERRLSDMPSPVPADGGSDGGDVSDDKLSDNSVDDFPRYFLLGSGRSRGWGYLDIQFLDGDVNRYFYRVAVRSDLDRMIYRLELDSFLHYHGLVARYESRSDVRMSDNGDFLP